MTTLEEAMKTIPADWFLYRLGEYVSGDLPFPTGIFHCSLQWRDGGGKLTSADGKTPTEALCNAIQAVLARADYKGSIHL